MPRVQSLGVESVTQHILLGTVLEVTRVKAPKQNFQTPIQQEIKIVIIIDNDYHYQFKTDQPNTTLRLEVLISWALGEIGCMPSSLRLSVRIFHARTPEVLLSTLQPGATSQEN